MTNVQKRMRKVENAELAILDGIEKASVDHQAVAMMTAMKDALLKFGTAFNLFREEAVLLTSHIKTFAPKVPQLVADLRAIRGKDCDSYLKETLEANVDTIGDSGRFLNLMRKISGEKIATRRMEMCADVRDLADDAITSVQSKISAMKIRIDRTECNENERQICDQKIIAFEEHLKSLKVRRDTVDDLYRESKRSILNFVKECDKRYGVKARVNAADIEIA